MSMTRLRIPQLLKLFLVLFTPRVALSQGFGVGLLDRKLLMSYANAYPLHFNRHLTQTNNFNLLQTLISDNATRDSNFGILMDGVLEDMTRTDWYIGELYRSSIRIG